MIKALLFDFSRVLLFSRDESYTGSLNEKHKSLSQENTYNLLDHFVLNDELLKYLDQIKEKVPLYIFTTDIIQDDPALKVKIDPIFKQIFSANKLGLSKQDPSSYQKLAVQISLPPEEILFIDDQAANVEIAKQAGLEAIQYQNNQQLTTKLDQILND